jgi:hypothetical protein
MRMSGPKETFSDVRKDHLTLISRNTPILFWCDVYAAFIQAVLQNTSILM